MSPTRLQSRVCTCVGTCVCSQGGARVLRPSPAAITREHKVWSSSSVFRCLISLTMYSSHSISQPCPTPKPKPNFYVPSPPRHNVVSLCDTLSRDTAPATHPHIPPMHPSILFHIPPRPNNSFQDNHIISLLRDLLRGRSPRLPCLYKERSAKLGGTEKKAKLSTDAMFGLFRLSKGRERGRAKIRRREEEETEEILQQKDRDGKKCEDLAQDGTEVEKEQKCVWAIAEEGGRIRNLVA